jgi:hypothetical protein
MFKSLQNVFNSFSVTSQRFQGQNPKYSRGNQGGKLITWFWMHKAFRIGTNHGTLKV